VISVTGTKSAGMMVAIGQDAHGLGMRIIITYNSVTWQLPIGTGIHYRIGD
jgi:hypothetical protein